jgi:N-acetylglutamate synthase-like GNAT family acetyltransferase
LGNIQVRRARRAELGAIFALIQQFDGSRLTPQQIMERATSYGYLVAEEDSLIAGAAGLLLTNSVACIRDLVAIDTNGGSVAVEALLASIGQEAAEMACEAVLVMLPAASESLALPLRERHYVYMLLEQMKGLWREVAAEHFPGVPGLWVYSLRSLEL